MNQAIQPMPNQALAVFARLGSRPIPRVVRMMDVARELGYATLFLSGRRESGLPESEMYAGHAVQRIGPYFPLLNGRAAFLYLRSVARYNLALFKELRVRKPALVHCSDFETMPAGLLYRAISHARLIYNIHDNLAQRYNIPGAAQWALNFFEGVAVRLSSIALVPEVFRRDTLPGWARKKVAVVRNTPADPGFRDPPANSVPIRLFFGGWLDRGRGISLLLDLVRANEDFEITFAGDGAPDLVDEIRKTPRTRYLGFVTHEEIMEETARAHYVVALYDPVRPINRYAASNKLAEALACGRPALVNCEMLIVDSLSEHKCLVNLPFANVGFEAAASLREPCAGDRSSYLRMCKAARKAYELIYSWDVAQKEMVAATLGNSCQSEQG